MARRGGALTARLHTRAHSSRETNRPLTRTIATTIYYGDPARAIAVGLVVDRYEGEKEKRYSRKYRIHENPFSGDRD